MNPLLLLDIDNIFYPGFQNARFTSSIKEKEMNFIRPPFHSAHPTGWAESISGIGPCPSVMTSKMIIISARRLHRPPITIHIMNVYDES